MDIKISDLLSTAPSAAIADADGFEVSQSAVSKGTTALKIGTYIRTSVQGYKEYSALMSQTGTSAPTVKVLKNDLGAAIVWTRGSAGNYVGTLTAAFTVNKTLLPPDQFQQYNASDFQNISITRTSANAVLVNTTIGANGAGVASDGVIVTDYPITIKVYY